MSFKKLDSSFKEKLEKKETEHKTLRTFSKIYTFEILLKYNFKSIIAKCYTQLCLGLIVCLGFGQNVNIPDANFKAYLIGNLSINTNGDSEIQMTEAASFVGHINIANSSISDLTGLEAFTALKVLNCHNIGLANLDVSANVNLQSLYCTHNNLTSLDLSQNTNLYQLICNNNNLGSLDLSNNVSLKYVFCQQNQLVSINTTGLTQLDVLFCGNNLLSAIDISNNNSLVELDISNNSISVINLSSSLRLEVLNVKENNIVILNTSQNVKLRSLDCGNNSLNELRIANGYNHFLKWFNAKNNANLSCIEVDDDTWAINNLSYGKDSSANFSEFCP